MKTAKRKIDQVDLDFCDPKPKAKIPKYDSADYLDFVDDFIEEVATSQDCNVTRWDVMNMMLEVIYEELDVNEHAHVARLIGKAQAAMYALPVEQRWRV